MTGSHPISLKHFSFWLRGDKFRGWYSCSDYEFDQGVAARARVASEHPNSVTFLGWSPLLPSEAKCSRADQFRLMVFPNLSMWDIPELADVAAPLRDELDADQLLELLRDTNPAFRDHLLLSDEQLRGLQANRGSSDSPWRRVRSLVQELSDLCRLDIYFACPTELQAVIISSLSQELAMSLAELVARQMPEAIDCDHLQEIVQTLHSTRTIRLCWD